MIIIPLLAVAAACMAVTAWGATGRKWWER